MSGLTVMRKVYVPRSGYFARYLEVLENPGTMPITVDVNLASSFYYDRVVATSSGDTAIGAGDQWIVGRRAFTQGA